MNTKKESKNRFCFLCKYTNSISPHASPLINLDLTIDLSHKE